MAVEAAKPASWLEAEAVPPLAARATLLEAPPAALTTCEGVVLVEVALQASPA